MSEKERAAIEQTISELEATVDWRLTLENQDKILEELRAM